MDKSCFATLLQDPPGVSTLEDNVHGYPLLIVTSVFLPRIISVALLNVCTYPHGISLWLSGCVSLVGIES